MNLKWISPYLKLILSYQGVTINRVEKLFFLISHSGK